MSKKTAMASALAGLALAAAAATTNTPAPLEGNQMPNSSFETGSDLADMFAWNRMPDVAYVVRRDDGWQVDAGTAWHGRQSLKSGGSTNSLLVPAELHAPATGKDSWTFSVFMKADHEGLPCRIQAGGYNNLRQEFTNARFMVGTEWRRYEMTARQLPTHRVCKHPARDAVKRVHGPMNFSITPLGPGVLWVDAVQWEAGAKASAYRPHPDDDSLPPAMPSNAPVAWSPMSAADSIGSAKAWRVPIIVRHAGTTSVANAAVQLGVPFPAGVWDGQGSIKLFAGAEAVPIVQHEVLARWPLDASIQSLGLSFEAKLAPGTNRFVLQPDASTLSPAAPPSDFFEETPDQWRVCPGGVVVSIDRRNGALWDAIRDQASGDLLFSGAALEGKDLRGQLYSSLDFQQTAAVVEKIGPAHVSIAKHGVIAAGGAGLLTYITRLHFWRNIPGIEVEVTFVNPRDEGAVVLRELYLKTEKSGVVGDGNIILPWRTLQNDRPAALGILQYYDPGQKQFVQTALVDGQPDDVRRGVRGDVWLGSAGADQDCFMLLRHGWQQHPGMLTMDRSEGWKAYIWPGRPAMGLTFSRGMSITRNFGLLFAGKRPLPENYRAMVELFNRPPVAFADPAWCAETKILLPFNKKDREKFPYMEAAFDALNDMQGPLSPENIEDKALYGLFDHGDVPGDGGWSNLESFLDYSMILLGLREGAPDILEQGFASARHYRDMDINHAVGYTVYHNSNHALGHYDFGHAWPQGIYAHYLLTGSRRSRDVALHNGEYMLEIPVDFGGIKGSRQLARFLLNLADVYQITGDARYRRRFMAQLEFAAEQLRSDPNPHRRDQTIFPWGSQRLDPYQVWYGCMGMVKMHQLTRDPAILPHLRREVEASLNMDFYALDLRQIWPGLPPAEGLPIAIALYNARHRGSFFYPLMTAYAEITGEPQWAELALKVAYVDALEGNHRIGGGAYEVIKTAALSAFPAGVTEAQWIEKMRELMWQAAAPSLLNGDFTKSDVWWEHWKPHANRAMAHDDLIGVWDMNSAGSAEQLKRERMDGKGWYVSPWQYYRRILATLDHRVFKGNAPSLRINLSRDWWTGTLTDTARVRLEPGTYRLSGWFRMEHLELAYFQDCVCWLDGRYNRHLVPLYNTGADPRIAADTELTDFKIRATNIAPAEADGWHFITHEFQVPQRCIVSFLWYANLQKGAPEGHLWLDGLSLRRMEEDAVKR